MAWSRQSIFIRIFIILVVTLVLISFEIFVSMSSAWNETISTKRKISEHASPSSESKGLIIDAGGAQEIQHAVVPSSQGSVLDVTAEVKKTQDAISTLQDQVHLIKNQINRFTKQAAWNETISTERKRSEHASPSSESKDLTIEASGAQKVQFKHIHIKPERCCEKTVVVRSPSMRRAELKLSECLSSKTH